MLTDGLAFNGSTWSPEMEACAPSGCLGDTPALGIDKHGLWCAPLSHPPPQCQRRQLDFRIQFRTAGCAQVMGKQEGMPRQTTCCCTWQHCLLPVGGGKGAHLAMC